MLLAASQTKAIIEGAEERLVRASSSSSSK
jgi:hypothetical protein